jgi:formamidopyrimidine-DNA glycosylase
VTELIRRGKHLGVVTSSRVMSVHLGMSGVLEVRSDGDLPPHTHVTWKLGPNQSLIFSDPRRFGGLTAYRSLEALARLSWGSLGPDALQATGEHLRHAAGRSTRPVKALLLDQHALAGVGNIYADESLFLAQVHPQAQCNTLTVDAWERLAASVRQVLASAIEHGGSTIRSYRNGVGSIGRAQERHTVYGRAGKPCLNCGLILSQGDICQRTTVWCEGCQGK